MNWSAEAMTCYKVLRPATSYYACLRSVYKI